MMKNNKKIISLFFILELLVLFWIGCYRGSPSNKPPVHLIPDMDSQPRYEAQEKSDFFLDKMAMRAPVEGTVAFVEKYEKDSMTSGQDENGKFLLENPFKETYSFLKRGQQRFGIYCSPCHSKLGEGKGILINHGYIPPPTFHSERLRNVEDGYIYYIIKNGIRNMYAYSHQIVTTDRWAIVAYVRSLQKSQNSPTDDVPEELRPQLDKK